MSGTLEVIESSFTYGSNKTLSYISAGPSDGPLIIFMHGWPAIARVWQPQIRAFSQLGFYVVAPNMPGYANSSHDKGDYAAYSIESNVNAMLSLLSHLSRSSAVWVGHDWGCGPLWGLAAHHPTACRAIVAMTLPYRIIELGLEEEVKHVNRTIYPADRFPYGQWGYQAFYEMHFEQATAWFEKDTPGAVKAIFVRGNPQHLTEPILTTADTVRDGGWFGGSPQPPSQDMIPDAFSVVDAETRKAVTEAMQKTGWWAANAWYMNHEANRKYTLEKEINGGKLDMPVLFFEALYDGVCATASTTMADPMKQYVKDLRYVSLKTGHWIAEEKPEEVSSAMVKWLVERVSDWWPKVDVKV